MVLPANPAQRAAVASLRSRTHPDRRYVPAHVTVKGTFSTDLPIAHLRRLIASVAVDHAPIHVTFASVEEWAQDGSFRVQMVHRSRELEVLHEALVDVLDSVSTGHYGPERGDAFRPHLTLYEGVPPDRIPATQRLAASVCLGTGFTAPRVDLVGRFGPRVTGPWRTLARVPFGSGTSRR